MPEPIIRVEHVSKTFITKERKKGAKKRKKEVVALKDVSLDVLDGEVFGLLGPNGAGKTTLIKCLTTLLIPSSGDAFVNGHSVLKEEDKVRASIGCMLMGDRGLYWKLTGRENLNYFGALYHIPKPMRTKRLEDLIALLELGEFVDRTVETYSSGQKMILAFAKSLINDAPILILDEPTVTMDVPTARKLRALVRDLHRQGKTILYTTHLMHEAEELCQRVGIIDHGGIIALGTSAELKASMKRRDVVEIEGIFPGHVVEDIRALAGVSEVAVKAEGNGRSKLAIASENSRVILPRLIETIVGNGSTIEYVKPQEVTLEDVFMAKTGRSLAVDTSEVGKAAEVRGGGGG
jgi:ABC-2 type transport system ATP-binding protein